LIRNKKTIILTRKLPWDCEVRGHCLCKEMSVIPVNRIEEEKRIIGQNGGPRRRRGTRGR
jgi:tetrahydromethanopterin S-methyltransferase subunit A